MSINIGPAASDDLRPRIAVIGVGGAGGNAIGNMMAGQIEGVEFIVVTTWESLEAIKRFAGEDSEVAVVPEMVQGWMIEYDRRARHYEVVD